MLVYLNCTFQNKILGGFHIISIHDEHGNLIFRENPKKRQKAETFRPWFITNCNESIDNVKIIAEIFEKEILECTNFDLDYDDQKIATHLQVLPMMDSKLINLATGLGR